MVAFLPLLHYGSADDCGIKYMYFLLVFALVLMMFIIIIIFICFLHVFHIVLFIIDTKKNEKKKQKMESAFNNVLLIAIIPMANTKENVMESCVCKE